MNDVQKRLAYPELQDFVGRHLLQGVDFEEAKVTSYDGEEDSQHIRFKIDGKIYVAVEDPEDGYRSSMKEIFLSTEKMKNEFKGQKVVGTYQGDERKVIEFRSEKTRKVVLEIGTDNNDEYYPSFVAFFAPENL